MKDLNAVVDGAWNVLSIPGWFSSLGDNVSHCHFSRILTGSSQPFSVGSPNVFKGNNAKTVLVTSLQKARFDVPVQLTESQRLLGGNMFTKQAVLPPHELVSALYPFKEIFHPLLTGEPGSVETYWQQNTDLLEAINDPNLEPWLLLYCWFCFCVQFGGWKEPFSFACQQGWFKGLKGLTNYNT